MNPFTYTRAADSEQAIAAVAAAPKAKFLGGGTNLIDLMKMGVESPSQLVDINRLPLAQVEELPDGKGVRIGALARNSDVAEHPLIVQRYPVLSQAFLGGASPQLETWPRSAVTFCNEPAAIIFTIPPFHSAINEILAAAAARWRVSIASTLSSVKASNASRRTRAI